MNRLQANAVLAHLISYYMFIIFIVCCIIYYSLFIAVGIDSHEPIRGFFYPANIIDHYIYLENYESLKNGNVNFVGINNIGIALVYYLSLIHISEPTRLQTPDLVCRLLLEKKKKKKK